MASLVDNLAKEIFQILKGSGRSLSLYDMSGQKVFEPEEARSIFARPDNIMISIKFNGSDSTLNMYVSETADLVEIRKLIDKLRLTATRFNFIFNVRKFGKELEPKDFAFKSEPMMEAMWGTARTSYEKVGDCKLIVRHSQRISEDKRGARSRRIHSIFVETADGERFRCPVNSLHGARAYARHLNNGGSSDDDFTRFIFSECEKQENLNRICRYIRSLPENENLSSLFSTLKQITEDSRNKIFRSRNNRFYNNLSETILNAPNYVGPLKSEIANQVQTLSTQLGIDENHSLFPVLESVAKIMLEVTPMEPINFEEDAILKTYISPNPRVIRDLVESFEGEFGLEEGTHFILTSDGIALLSEDVFETARMYADTVEGVDLVEAPHDKFLMFATQWVKANTNVDDMAELHTPEKKKEELSRRANDLAMGLKRLIAGHIKFKLKDKEMPRFSDPNATIAFKLDMALRPGVGLDDDTLWNFVSELSRKLSYGEQMDPNERFFAKKIADAVDAAMVEESVIPEQLELEEWINSFDPLAIFNKNENVSESNYPDDYDAKRDPNASDDSDFDDEAHVEFKKIARYWVKNPPEDSSLALTLKDVEAGEDMWSNGGFRDTLNDLMHEIATEVISEIGDNEDPDAVYYLANDESLRAFTRDLLVKEFNIDKSVIGECDLNERVDVHGERRMRLHSLLSTVPSFIKKGAKTPDEVVERMREYYMDSRSMGPLVHEFEDEIYQKASELLNVNEGYPGDMGDDFIDDIKYVQDDEEAAMIERLRKLAGI